jgi:hypothetical protein
MHAADFVVGRAKKQSPSERIFSFPWLALSQAANASRWAEKEEIYGGTYAD